jgi:hypothetical protein
MIENNAKDLKRSDRTKGGLFAKGNQVAAVTHPRPYQAYSQRAAYIEETYTAEEILAIASNPKKLKEKSVRDVQIIQRLARTLAFVEPANCADVERALDAHLERIEGMPKRAEGEGGATVIVNLLNLDDGKPLMHIDNTALDNLKNADMVHVTNGV